MTLPSVPVMNPCDSALSSPVPPGAILDGGPWVTRPCLARPATKNMVRGVSFWITRWVLRAAACEAAGAASPASTIRLALASTARIREMVGPMVGFRSHPA